VRLESERADVIAQLMAKNERIIAMESEHFSLTARAEALAVSNKQLTVRSSSKSCFVIQDSLIVVVAVIQSDRGAGSAV
jgi:hypothetical protein